MHEQEFFGHTQLFKNLIGRLEKKVPDPISLVGLPGFGKSTLLKAIETHARRSGHFAFVIYWRMTREIPNSETKFISLLVEKLIAELRSDPEARVYGDHLAEEGVDYDSLKQILELLEEDGKPCLFIWDGLDKPLERGYLPLGLWDNMRALFSIESHGLVLSSREPLQNLINEEIEQSEFWNILNRHDLPSLDLEGLEQFLQGKKISTDSPGVLKEIFNQTGGVPEVVYALIKEVDAEITDVKVVQAAAEKANQQAELKRYANKFWGANESLKESYIALFDRKSGSSGDDQFKKHKASLLRSGLATENKGKLEAIAWLLASFVGTREAQQEDVLQYFGTDDQYVENMKVVLDQRLREIPIIDNESRRLVKKSIQELASDPQDSWTYLSRINKSFLNWLMRIEFGNSKSLPTDLVAYWSGHKELPDWLRESFDNTGYAVPNDDTTQLHVVKFLTGSIQHFENRAKYATKRTYTILQSLKTLRNFEEHGDGEVITPHLAVAGLALAVELMDTVESL